MFKYNLSIINYYSVKNSDISVLNTISIIKEKMLLFLCLRDCLLVCGVEALFPKVQQNKLENVTPFH